MLLKSKRVPNAPKEKIDIRKVYACVFRPAKIMLRKLFKQNSLKLMVKFININQFA